MQRRRGSLPSPNESFHHLRHNTGLYPQAADVGGGSNSVLQLLCGVNGPDGFYLDAQNINLMLYLCAGFDELSLQSFLSMCLYLSRSPESRG
jgi:hypothetical protein